MAEAQQRIGMARREVHRHIGDFALFWTGLYPESLRELQGPDRRDQFDVMCTVVGGGLSGQAGAVKHGISVALTRYEPTLRTTVKQAGFLTRDPRVVERKKYGKAKARKSFQFSKR